MALQVVVTTCCGRNVAWLGQLFSTSGWRSHTIGQDVISLSAILGERAHLLVYDKGGNVSTAQHLRQQITANGMDHPQSLTVVAAMNANGREGHTIAHHIAENHERLAPVTTFIQGDAKSNHMLALVYLHMALLNASAQVQQLQQPQGHTSPRHRAIIQRLRESMNAADGSTSAAALCPATKTPPLLCEAGARSPDFREWPCPKDFAERQKVSRRPLHHMGGYTSL